MGSFLWSVPFSEIQEKLFLENIRIFLILEPERSIFRDIKNFCSGLIFILSELGLKSAPGVPTPLKELIVRNKTFWK